MKPPRRQMSSTLAAAKPISAKVSRAASSRRSTVSARRRWARLALLDRHDAGLYWIRRCIRYTLHQTGETSPTERIYGHKCPWGCGQRERGGAPFGQAPRRCPSDRRLLPGVFLASHAIAEGTLSEQQLRTRGYRRLVQGV